METSRLSLPVRALAVASIVAFLASGCTVGRRSLTMDSNSRIPFFGLELRERSPKSSAPRYNSISRKNRDLSRVKPAVNHWDSSTQFNFRRRGTAESTRVISHPEPNAVSQAARPTDVSVTETDLSLPRTDRSVKAAPQIALSANVDFQ